MLLQEIQLLRHKDGWVYICVVVDSYSINLISAWSCVCRCGCSSIFMVLFLPIGRILAFVFPREN